MISREVFSYWCGPVTWMERLSCASIVSAGHSVTIFTHTPSELRAHGLGVAVEDARDVLNAPDLEALRARAPDHFSDWFRVEGLARGIGTWCDLDMVLLKPLGDEPCLMAWERPNSICNAVLRLPPDSAALAAYLAFCRRRPITYAPPWYPMPQRAQMTWKRFEKWATGKHPPRLLYGPAALTHFAVANGMAQTVFPQATYYPFSPMHLDDMRVFTDGDAVTHHFNDTTRAVHLWRSLYRRVNGASVPPRGSWLGRMAAAFDVASADAA